MTKSGTTGKFDTRQELMWSCYANPRSETYLNASTSALKAGYSQSTAHLITTTPWFKEKKARLQLVLQAEMNIQEFADMPKYLKRTITEIDPITKKKKRLIIKVLDETAARFSMEASRFALTTLAKKRYSTRNELTGAGGGPVKTHELDKAEYAKIDKTIRRIVGDFKGQEATNNSLPE
jgi:hypothetical protein